MPIQVKNLCTKECYISLWFFLDIILASNDSLPVLDGKQNLLMWAYCLGDEKIYFFVFFEKRFLD